MSVPENIKAVYEKATLLFSKEQVEVAFDEMAKKIHQQVAESNPILLCVMIGGMIPTANLLQRLDFPLELDYIHVTRYHGKTRGGELYWKVIPSVPLENRNVVIVDDILDGGLTMAAIIDFCKREGASSVTTAVLVDKLEQRHEEGTQSCDITGLTVEAGYVFGYGMDYKEYLRNAQGIYVVADEHK